MPSHLKCKKCEAKTGGKRVQENKKIKDLKSGKVKQGKNEAVGNEIDKYQAVYVLECNDMFSVSVLFCRFGLIWKKQKQKPDADTGNVINNLSEGLETEKNVLLHQFELKKTHLVTKFSFKKPPSTISKLRVDA